MATIDPVYTKIPQMGKVEYTLGGKVSLGSTLNESISARFSNLKATTTINVKSTDIDAGDAIKFKDAGGTSYILSANDTTTTSTNTTTPTYEIGETRVSIAGNIGEAIAALNNFTAEVVGADVHVTQSTAGEDGNTRVTNANKTAINVKSFRGGGEAYDEHDEATTALTAGYAKTTADAKILEHVRKRNLGLI